MTDTLARSNGSLDPHASSSGASSSGAAGIDETQQHYEINSAFFRLMLGSSFTYSAAFWQDGDDDHADLAKAQERKLDVFADLVGAQPATRIVDVGCGWGSALERLVDEHDVDEAVGLTPSRAQVDHIRRLGNDKITVGLGTWEDHEPLGLYDGILCINAIEEFARSGQSPKERGRQYRKFFRRCHNWLNPHGKIALHMISMGKPPLDREVLRDMISAVRSEFADSHVPHLHELASATQMLFEVTEIQNDRKDCARTMRVWLERLQRHRDEAVELEGVATVARYERYLEVCARLFDEGYFNDYRIALTKIP
jgi:cyclopropane-fatty-acyl-phospholipid synthase